MTARAAIVNGMGEGHLALKRGPWLILVPPCYGPAMLLRRGPAFALLPLILALAGCADGDAWPSQDSSQVAARSTPVIDGTPAPEISGVVAIGHDDATFLCGGTVVHPRLVLTAAHCVAIPGAGNPDLPLRGDHFRVGFGPADAQLTYIPSLSVVWPGSEKGQDPDVKAMGEAGTDVAAIFLAADVPPGTQIYPVSTRLEPDAGESFQLVGYGRTSVEVPVAGVKTTANDVLYQWGRSTGIIRITGKGACAGDSGGPMLGGTVPEWVGAISRAAFSAAAGSAGASAQPGQAVECQSGLTDASTVFNPVVRDFVLTALQQAAINVPGATGGAGGGLPFAPTNPRPASAGTGNAPAQVAPASVPQNGPAKGASCNCSSTGSHRSGAWVALGLLLAGLIGRRRRKLAPPREAVVDDAV